MRDPRPLTWERLWPRWVAVLIGYISVDVGWFLSGGDWLLAPFWMECLGGAVVLAVYWRWEWKRDREREQAVSEEDPG